MCNVLIFTMATTDVDFYYDNTKFERQILLSQKFQSYFRKILRDFKTVDGTTNLIDITRRGRRSNRLRLLNRRCQKVCINE